MKCIVGAGAQIAAYIRIDGNTDEAKAGLINRYEGPEHEGTGHLLTCNGLN